MEIYQQPVTEGYDIIEQCNNCNDNIYVIPVESPAEATEKDTLKVVRDKRLEDRLYIATEEPSESCPRCAKPALRKKETICA